MPRLSRKYERTSKFPPIAAICKGVSPLKRVSLYPTLLSSDDLLKGDAPFLTRYLTALKFPTSEEPHPALKYPTVLTLVVGVSALCSAVERGDYSEVIRLLRERPSYVNVKCDTSTGDTPLHLAVKKGNTKLVKTLIDHGGDVLAENLMGDTPLDLAFSEGKEEVLRYAVRSYLRKHRRGIDKRVVLYAPAVCNLSEVKRLLRRVKLSKEERERAALHAALYGNLEVFKYFVERKLVDMTPKYIHVLLSWLVYNGLKKPSVGEVVRYILQFRDPAYSGMDKAIPGVPVLKVASQTSGENGVSVGLVQEEPLLHAAVESGNLYVVKALVEYCGDIGDVNVQDDYNGYTPLHLSVAYKHKEIVEYLMEQGADPTLRDFQGRTPCDMASDGGYVKLLKGCALHVPTDSLCRLLRSGEDTMFVSLSNRDSLNLLYLKCEYMNTPLHIAARRGDTFLLRYVSEKYLPVCQERTFAVRELLGWTPMHTAAWWGQLPALSYMVESGGRIDSRADNGATPLCEAVYWGHMHIVRYLHRKGAKVSVGYNCPLCMAVYTRNIEAVRYFVEEMGANLFEVCRIDDYPYTPLYPFQLAVVRGDTVTLGYMISKGVDVNKIYVPGLDVTLLHLAAWEKQEDVIRYLLRHGADPTVKNKAGATPCHMTDSEELKEIMGYCR